MSPQGSGNKGQGPIPPFDKLTPWCVWAAVKTHLRREARSLQPCFPVPSRFSSPQPQWGLILPCPIDYMRGFKPGPAKGVAFARPAINA